MFGLRCRSGRQLRRQLTVLRRQMSGNEKESPAQQERRIMDEEEKRSNLEFYSVFELLRPQKASAVEFLQRVNAIKFTKAATVEFLEDKVTENRVLQQRFLEDRHRALGFDLAAAHFVVARGGRVRFQGDKRWVVRTEEGAVPLPARYTHGMYVEELDASGTEIVYEGLENFIKLTKLRALYLRDCPFVDDWCVDRVCGEYRHSLRHLDLSGCPRVTEHGLEGIAQLKELKSLTLERMDHIRILPYVCLLLEDAIPGLEIRGVDVLQPPPADLLAAADSQSQAADAGGSQSQTDTQARPTAGDQSRPGSTTT